MNRPAMHGIRDVKVTGEKGSKAAEVRRKLKERRLNRCIEFIQIEGEIVISTLHSMHIFIVFLSKLSLHASFSSRK